MPLPVIPDAGNVTFMTALLLQLKSGANDAKVHLYTNNLAPVRETVLTDFTEAVAAGLEALATPAAVDVGINAAGVDVWTFSPLTWSAGGSGLPVVVYGYYVDWLNPITLQRQLWWAQKFDVPQALTGAGQTVSFTLSIGGDQREPASE